MIYKSKIVEGLHGLEEFIKEANNFSYEIVSVAPFRICGNTVIEFVVVYSMLDIEKQQADIIEDAYDALLNGAF